MRIIKTAQLPRTPWKNGGGETVEIIAHPPGAGFDTFDWRISTATVASDGPFSIFPGIDRTLSILNGEGIELVIDGQPPVTLTATSPPLAFPADQAATALLINGPVVDLNVMSRRGVVRHAQERLLIDRSVKLDGIGITVVFCQAGELSIEADNTRHSLAPTDCAILDPGDTSFTLTSATQGIALIIRINDVRQAALRPGSPR